MRDVIEAITAMGEVLGQWSVVTTTQIKPEFRLEYEVGHKDITAAYKKPGYLPDGCATAPMTEIK